MTTTSLSVTAVSDSLVIALAVFGPQLAMTITRKVGIDDKQTGLWLWHVAEVCGPSIPDSAELVVFWCFLIWWFILPCCLGAFSRD